MEDTVFSDDDSEVNTITFHAPKYVVNIFTTLHEMQTRSSDENSVCPSVCPSHA